MKLLKLLPLFILSVLSFTTKKELVENQKVFNQAELPENENCGTGDM